jgi:hypothetical protein
MGEVNGNALNPQGKRDQTSAALTSGTGNKGGPGDHGAEIAQGGGCVN